MIRALHYVFKIADRKMSRDFFVNILKMKVFILLILFFCFFFIKFFNFFNLLLIFLDLLKNLNKFCYPL